MNGLTRRISIEWKGGTPAGQILVTDGDVSRMRLSRGQGKAEGGSFAFSGGGPCRLDLVIEGTKVRVGKGSTVVTVHSETNPFSFFLRDVDRRHPIYIPAYEVVVTEADDGRSYDEIAAAIRGLGLQSNFQRIESEPEESYENAAESTRELSCETWLGLSRDMRIFVVDERLETIRSQFAGAPVSLPEMQDTAVTYSMMIGRGWGSVDLISRRLEEGTLPILRGTVIDEEVRYDVTAFVTLEGNPLTPQSVRGTHFLVADGYCKNHSFTKEQQGHFDSLAPGELNQAEETVLCLRVEAVNTSRVPRYAFFKNVTPNIGRAAWGGAAEWSFDGISGFGLYKSGRVFAISRLNGSPMQQEEVAILLRPGETMTIVVYMPHRPITQERALKLGKTDFTQRHRECREFWRKKLASAAQISIPDPPMNEMIQAGLLQMDLIMYGQEPDGPLAPSIGVYSPIGVYSDATIQFMDSMGWHDTARRALDYFLAKQHDDGFMQNFKGYMAETGAILADMGEHYRYTRDDQWVEGIAPKLIKSCEYIRQWRQRNRREELRGRGYGLIDGKTADPEDPFHSFLLNGYAYLGLSRVAEMLAKINPAEAEKWRKEAVDLKDNIRATFFDVMAKSPVVPLGDGSWCPTVPPWAESRGAVLLFADGGRVFSHKTFTTRDSLLGPLYLVTTEVFDPEEPATTFMLNFHNELMTRRNVALSQPYLSRHPTIHLKRDEVKAFLKAHYNLFASIADRQTHTFWEHYFGGSPHSVDGVNWFLMDVRSMLYLEKDQTLQLLPGIPRRYLEGGKRIEVKNAASYFGPLSFRVDSRLDHGVIEATLECNSDRRPKRVELRLPHPQGRKAISVEGGRYDAEKERVTIDPFDGRAEVALRFSK